jgi:hypothetical protein
MGLLAIALYAPALAVGFVGNDLITLDTVLRTRLGALLSGGALPGDYAPLSRELWWWWWGRTLALDVTALHVLNAALAVGCGWMLYRAVEARAGTGAARLAALAWAVFPPLGSMLGAVSGARELMATFWVAATVLRIPPAWYGVHAPESAARAARRGLRVVSLDPVPATRAAFDSFRTAWRETHGAAPLPLMGLGRFIVVA